MDQGGKVVMIHPGRPRKSNVVREPNGRGHRERDFSPAEVKRARLAIMLGLRDQEWGSELGLMCLQRTITDYQFAAGKWWAAVASRYAEAIAARPHPRAVPLELGSVGHEPDPDSELGQEIAEKHRDYIEQFDKTLKALKEVGTVSVRVVRDICEYDRPPTGYLELEYLRAGLTKLAEEHAKLTRPKKNVR